MKPARYVSYLPMLTFIFNFSCKSQTNEPGATGTRQTTVGGRCENCEIMYVGMPSGLQPVDTCSGWYEEGKKLSIKGIVYKHDGKTPAPGVILYYYHTDHRGNYSKKNDKPENATVHGYMRGWVKTGNDGRYEIFTIRPAAYPGNSIPAHIHVIVKEPGINEYYIDELVFDDDPYLTNEQRSYAPKKGGDGTLKVTMNDTLQVAGHNIILGLNIAGYPAGR